LISRRRFKIIRELDVGQEERDMSMALRSVGGLALAVLIVTAASTAEAVTNVNCALNGAARPTRRFPTP
jgi:hypothetical protein